MPTNCKTQSEAETGTGLRGTGRFWETKSLEQMTAHEWEALCDGCGKCCLHKIEDPSSGAIEYTCVACRYLDLETTRCTRYPQRQRLVSGCVTLTPENVRKYDWLPETCAYRRLAVGRPLPEWHPLLTGDPESTRRAGMSVAGDAVSEDDIEEFKGLI